MEDDLRNRWDSPEGLLLGGEVLARLKTGAALDGLGLGEIAGRVDLRGFPAPLPRPLARADVARWRAGKLAHEVLTKKAEPIALEGVTLRGLDLSWASLDRVTVRDAVVEDCKLEGVSGRDMGFARSRVRDTSFRGADLRGAVLGPWRNGTGNEYVRADFTGADLRKAPFISAWFRDADFSGTRLDNVRFMRCGLVRCRFSGLLNGVLFSGTKSALDEGEPNYWEDVDMSDAAFQNVTFSGIDLDAVSLPADPALWVVRNYHCVARKVVEALVGREDEHSRFLRRWFEAQLEVITPERQVELLNGKDLVPIGGVELMALAESVIRQAQRECETPNYG